MSSFPVTIFNNNYNCLWLIYPIQCHNALWKCRSYAVCSSKSLWMLLSTGRGKGINTAPTGWNDSNQWGGRTYACFRHFVFVHPLPTHCNVGDMYLLIFFKKCKKITKGIWYLHATLQWTHKVCAFGYKIGIIPICLHRIVPTGGCDINTCTLPVGMYVSTGKVLKSHPHHNVGTTIKVTHEW